MQSGSNLFNHDHNTAIVSPGNGEQIIRISNPDGGFTREIAWLIENQIYSETEKNFGEKNIEAMKMNQDSGLVLECIRVSQVNELLGAAVISRVGCSDGVVYLYELAVQKESRRKGVGSKLATAAMQLARGRDARKMVLYPKHDAVGFYQKLGFELIGSSGPGMEIEL